LIWRIIWCRTTVSFENGSRFANWIFLWVQNGWDFSKPAEVNAHPSQIALGANAAAGDIRYVDVNGDGVLDK
jgi:hypothetical protein